MVDFEFRSAVFYVRAEDDDDSLGGQDSRRILVNTYDGDYPDLDAGLMAFLFRGSEAQDEKLELKFPAARVPHDFCQRLLKAAMSDGSRSIVSLFFVAAIDDLTVKLEGFDEYASEPGEATIVYKVPQSSASDMLLELKISELADAPNGWKLVDFCRDKKPPPSMGAGGGGGGGWGGGSGFFDLLENGFGLFGNGGGWAGDNEYENDDE
ncbi:hypothetical protein AAVH_42845 [Aphelenchoides avenae]|nr:hypothetical protein AAVH_42845 [Aphelenchus avenae]